MNRHTRWTVPLLVGLSTILVVAASGCIFTSSPKQIDSPTDSEDTGVQDTSGGDAAEDSGDAMQETGPAPVPVDELSDAYADTFCDFLFRCCSRTERGPAVRGLEFDLTSKPACLRKYGGLLEASLVASLGTAIEKGRVTYDAEGMANCLNEIKTASCEVFPTELSESEPCQDNIEPQVALGDKCKKDFECKQGICLDDNPNDDISTCQKLPGRGDECPNGRCPDGMYCDGNARTCQPKETIGESCGWGGDCKSGLCNANDKCAEKRPTGGACSNNANCESDACKNADGNMGGTCLASPLCDGQP